MTRKKPKKRKQRRPNRERRVRIGFRSRAKAREVVADLQRDGYRVGRWGRYVYVPKSLQDRVERMRPRV